MKILNSILIACFLGFTFVSCDKVEAPYKEEVVKPVTDKKVLLEDYTGHLCIYCPAAHVVADDLLDIYGDNLIVVAVHAGAFYGRPDAPPLDYEFRTPAGEDYLSTLVGLAGFPVGIINRMNDGGSYLVAKDNWGTVVAELLKEEAEISIEITTDLQSRKLSGEISIEFLSNISNASSVQIWITEDHIIEAQKFPSETIVDYEHNHVMRGAVNGSWGEALPQTSYSENDTETISFSNFQLGEDWVAENLSIIAYVYDNESNKVIQVNKKKIIE